MAATAIASPVALAQSDDAAVVQAHVNAYRSGSLDAFVATFAKDATVTANGLTATGHAEIRKLYSLNFKPGAPKIKIVESGLSGPNVYINAAYVFKDGREMCCSYSEYTIKNGKITYLVSSG
ncbi:MAG: nuclear transport factor 2 family protein [Pseudomonadota bacterium]